MTAKTELDLRECVAMTLQPDLETKKRAEKRLEELSLAPGFLEALLQMTNTEKEPGMRMVSSIYFRRFLEKFWIVDGFAKESIIQNFPSFLISASSESEKQLFAALEFILKNEEVEMWHPIMRAFESFLGTENEQGTVLGLKILNRVIVSLIDGYKSEKDFEKILDTTGERIISIGEKAIASQNFELGALVMKVFAHSCESYILPDMFKHPVFIQKLITLSIHGSNPSTGSVSLIKWSLVLVNNLFKKTKKKKVMPSFECLFSSEVLGLLYNRSVSLLTECNKHAFSSKVEKEALSMLKHVALKDAGSVLVRRDMNSIIGMFILPAVSFSDELEEMWADSQVEFLRHQEAGYSHTPSSVASELFFELVRMCKENKAVVESIFAEVIKLISVHDTAQTEETAKIRYGGLFLFKTTAKFARENDKVFEIVLKDLSSSYSIVKYVAFSSLQHFSYYRRVPESVLGAFMAAISSPDDAVVVESILCLPHLLEAPETKKKLEGNVPAFIKLLLELSNKIQIEPLSTALEDVIVLCQSEALSIAPSIAEAISYSIIKLLNEEEEEDQPEEKYEVIDGYIRTINTLIESLEKSPESIMAVMKVTKEMIITVARNHRDFLPEMLPLIVTASYTLKSVENMYDILEEILNLPIEELSVYMCEISGMLDNYITYGKPGITKYLEKILHIIEKTLDEYPSEYDFPYICRVLESIVLNISPMMGEKVFDLLKVVITLAFKNKELLKPFTCQIAAIEVVLGGFIMAPPAAVKIMRDMGKMEYLSKILATNYKKFERVHDLKLLLLFSGMFLSQPPHAQIPEMSSAMLIELFHYSLVAFPEAFAYREALKNGEHDDMDDEEYYEKEYLDEDPTFETPLDAIDPFKFAMGVYNTGGETVLSSIWGTLPEKMQSQIISGMQNKK
ncbi:importin-7 [Nematocida sp. AWRm77]|nr:importin-7 [Nematocida sp. AWRm77]